MAKFLNVTPPPHGRGTYKLKYSDIPEVWIIYFFVHNHSLEHWTLSDNKLYHAVYDTQ